MGVVFQRAGAGGFRKSMLVWHSVPSRRSSHLSAAKPKPVRAGVRQVGITSSGQVLGGARPGATRCGEGLLAANLGVSREGPCIN